MPTLVRKTLGEYRRSVIGWLIGISAFLSLYLSIYPSIRSNPEFYQQAALSKYPGPLKDLMGGLADIASGSGYLQTVVYQLLVPLLLIMCAMTLGTRAIAVPEEQGTLELTMTLPIDRRRLVLDRWAAFALSLLAVALVTLILVLALAAVGDLKVPAGNIVAAHAGLFLIAFFFGTLALTLGAATGKRAFALAVGGGYAVAGYVIETLGKSVDAISWLRWVSPFHYYLDGRPVFQGWPVGDYLVILGATAVLAMTAVLAFERRDVGV
ncbi:ABC transporter permease [Planotetraspora phitsanulokensis]|uniref:ABC transporter permease n=1 Tax=Planotetraspora phitsanulokensis TaxID=575192 RepID=A0A8J3UBK7_9ACTN|nr:ABC transporter permease subunit [Planotetraspora phitsanulokensis]GII40351.1 ABC transporter permease [Planotetraspora phitsanulokensis]